MAHVITQLIIYKPQNAALATLNYFKWRQQGCPHLRDKNEMFKVTGMKETSDRLYAIRHISPLLNVLLTNVIKDQPDFLDQYIVNCLSVALEKGGSSTVSIALDTKKIQPAPLEIKPDSAVEHMKAVSVVVLGLDNAGKTTFLYSLQGDMQPNAKPTTGFRPLQMMFDGKLKVKFYDLGGGEKIRSIWANYYHDVHGVIYVLDSSDHSKSEEALKIFNSSINHEYLAGKPVLLLVNKQDIPDAKSPESIRQDLRLCGGETKMIDPDIFVQGCVANPVHNNATIDPCIDQGMKWLFGRIKNEFRILHKRVDNDIKEVQLRFEREKSKKDWEVLKQVIQKAFPLDGKTKEDCFGFDEVRKDDNFWRLRFNILQKSVVVHNQLFHHLCNLRALNFWLVKLDYQRMNYPHLQREARSWLGIRS